MADTNGTALLYRRDIDIELSKKNQVSRSYFYFRILIVDEEPIEKYTDLHGNSTFPIAHVVSKNIFQYFGTWLNYFVAPIFNDLVTQATNGNENGPKLIIVGI